MTGVFITREPKWPKDCDWDFPFDEVLTCTRCPNILKRFELAAETDGDTVYVQDDDNEIDIRALYNLHFAQDNPGLTTVMPKGMQAMYAGTGVALIGYGAIFPREFARRFLDRVPYWESVFGQSIVLMEADRLFTFDNRDRTRIVNLNVRQIQRRVKMCERPGHYQTRTMIFKTLKELL